MEAKYMPVATSEPVDTEVDVDVAVIGAGIAGINMGYYIQSQAPTNTSYAIFEGRDTFGGTWDLFRYPGIRSDSDIYTFGFAWYPWTKNIALASAGEILEYMGEAAWVQGIDKHIRYKHKIVKLSWSTKQQLWTLTAHVGANGEPREFRARFVVLGTGYYNYEEPLQAIIPGIESFEGTTIRPQFWPADADYADKNVVIIGSGATAVTILPSMADKAKHTTMLQRSPTYIIPMEQGSALTKLILDHLPVRLAGVINRFRYVVLGYLFFYFCTLFPERAKRTLKEATMKQLPPTVSYDPHFLPRYDPWNQRLCACPDGDFFAALRNGKASVVTDTIKTVTPDSIQLTSGEELHPDVIVVATGLQIRFAGGIEMSVDGRRIDPSQHYSWKGCMMQDVPNLAFIMGYINASYSLAAETTALIVVRVLHHMKKADAAAVIAVVPQGQNMEFKVAKPFSSTYLKNAHKIFPKPGQGQWSPRWNYLVDLWKAKWGDTITDLRFS